MSIVSKLKNNIKSNLIPGIIVVVPLVISLIVLRWLINFFDSLIQPALKNYIHIYIPGLGILVSLIFIYLVGLSTKNYFGNKLVQVGEWIVVRIPVAKTVYLAVKQIITTITSREKKKTQKVVMIEYPGKDLYSLGLYNGLVEDPVNNRVMGSILVITSINPTSGFTVLVPVKNIRLTDLTVEQMMRFVVSGGLVIPEKLKTLPFEGLPADNSELDSI
ncbi:MAG: DUF502 domain-containing protein [Calditrichaeota bacterium]|nr:DUF502 domain-containing protein [Calditrichota bacterium]RQW08142.1 MAG: DUF502 domain-containing protein [Calditrichota bacterium]